MNIINRIVLGVKRYRLKSLIFVYCTYAVLWTIMEPLISHVPTLKITGVVQYLLMVLFAIVVGAWKILPSKELTINLNNTNTSIRILFGDIFSSDGHKVIPVNEFFDSEIGDHVAPTSLHGMYIQKILRGRSHLFDGLANWSLSNVPHELTERKTGRNKKFPIGTTLVNNTEEAKYFLVALSRTDVKTLKAKADVPELWQALNGLWEKVRIEAGGSPVNIPLIGSGLSGVGLPPQQLLRIIMMSILDATKKWELTSEIRIVLHETVFEHIDLNVIQKDWR